MNVQVKMNNRPYAVRECEKLWLSQKEAVRYLGVSKDWLDARKDNGQLNFAKVGNVIFYAKSEIDNLIAKNAVNPMLFRRVIESDRKRKV